MQIVLLGEAVGILGNIVEHGAPAVIKGRVAFPQRDGHHLKAELVRQLSGNGLVALPVQITAVNIGRSGLNAKHILGILLIGDAHIHVLAQLRHSCPRLLPGPQLAPVVQVTGDLAAVGLGSDAGFLAHLHKVRPQCGGNAGEVEPVGTFKNPVPVEIGGSSLLNGRMGTVVNAHAAPLGSALLIVVNADPVAAPNDQGGVHTVAAQRIDRGLTDCMGRKLGHIGRIYAVVCQRHGNVRLAAAEGKLHMVALNKTLVVIGLKPQHQLTESNNSAHFALASFTISTLLRHSSVISSQAPA